MESLTGVSLPSECASSGYQSGSSIASVASVSSVLSEASSQPTIGTTGGGNTAPGTSVGQPGAAGSNVKKEKKLGQGPKKERQPRLHLKKVSKNAEGTVVECIFDTYKNNTITFRFGIDVDAPYEVATNMVSCIKLTFEVIVFYSDIGFNK